MDGEQGDWLMLGLQYFTLALIYGSLIFMAISELLSCFQRWRCRHDAELAAGRLLESVPDVSYHQLPDPDASSSSCVICMEDYREGERCFVLPGPGCAHTFHRGCIAPWLRQGKTTCPTCRRSAVVIPPAHQQCTTAEDMV